MAAEPVHSSGEEPPKGAARLRVQAPEAGDAPNLYANYASVTLSPHDFTLRFGQYALPDEAQVIEGELRVPARAVVTVTVPLNLAISLAQTLEGQARRWEETFGQPLPEQPGEPPETP